MKKVFAVMVMSTVTMVNANINSPIEAVILEYEAIKRNISPETQENVINPHIENAKNILNSTLLASKTTSLEHIHQDQSLYKKVFAFSKPAARQWCIDCEKEAGALSRMFAQECLAGKKPDEVLHDMKSEITQCVHRCVIPLELAANDVVQEGLITPADVLDIVEKMAIISMHAIRNMSNTLFDLGDSLIKEHEAFHEALKVVEDMEAQPDAHSERED